MGTFQQRAVFEYKQAWIGGEFGESFARRKFGDDIVNELPIKKRGKYKGRFNATISWVKVKVPGWVPVGKKLYHDEYHPGYVETRREQIVAVILFSDTSSDGFVIHAIDGDTWHFTDELRMANTNPNQILKSKNLAKTLIKHGYQILEIQEPQRQCTGFIKIKTTEESDLWISVGFDFFAVSYIHLSEQEDLPAIDSNDLMATTYLLRDIQDAIRHIETEKTMA